jgi:hypothetical protein
LRPVELFVGFQIQRNRAERSLKIHQEFYILKLLQRLKLENSNPVWLPVPAGTVLKPNNNNLLEGDDITVYRQIVESLLDLANSTCPDISYVVGQLARFMSKLGIEYYQTAKHLIRYIKGVRTVRITYSNRTERDLTHYDIYTNATWGTENDRISFQGMAVTRYRGAISWAAQRQRSIALSSMEAEVMSVSEGGKEAVWLQKLTRDLGERSDDKEYIPTLYCDNLRAIELLHNTKFHRKAKHIEI